MNLDFDSLMINNSLKGNNFKNLHYIKELII